MWVTQQQQKSREERVSGAPNLFRRRTRSHAQDRDEILCARINCEACIRRDIRAVAKAYIDEAEELKRSSREIQTGAARTRIQSLSPTKIAEKNQQLFLDSRTSIAHSCRQCDRSLWRPEAEWKHISLGSSTGLQPEELQR
jgi:hypothetical protein